VVEHPAPSAAVVAPPPAEAVAGLAGEPAFPGMAAVFAPWPAFMVTMGRTMPAVGVLMHTVFIPSNPGQDGSDEQDIEKIYLEVKIYLSGRARSVPIFHDPR
jgi:hypothetical protein